MSNTEHSGGAAPRTFRCTFGPVREVDLVWPPPDEEIDAFTVVRLDDGDAKPAPITPPLPPAAAAPAQPARFEPRRIKPTFGDCRALGTAPRVRPFFVPMEPPPLPATAKPDAPAVAAPVVAAPEDMGVADALDDDTMVAAEALPPLPMSGVTRERDAETSGASRSAWLAVFFAAACALVTFAEYRATLPGGGAEAPPEPPEVSVADVPPPAVHAVRPPASSKPVVAQRTAAATPTRPIPAPAPPPKPAAASAPVPAPSAAPRLAAVAPSHDAGPVATTTRRPEPQPAVMTRVDAPPTPTPTPAPTLVPAAVTAAKPEPLASAGPATPVAAAVLVSTTTDEAGIQSTLTRFRTAYSQLNASAARDVWPSVDTRALERAFQSLKSQDLRFDSCKMTVTGARAQAACKGRAVYVPRIGDQSPRFTSREWSFELRKADERWTIASARSL